MLTRLNFKNFKAWKDSDEIRLAPLTVLFGTNSAGKTSIPQLLLLLKQTAESSDRKRALQLGDDRTLVNLGRFEEAVHGHDLQSELAFSLTWGLSEALQVVDPLRKKSLWVGDALRFDATIGAGDKRQPMVKSFTYELLQGNDSTLALYMKRRKDSGFDLTAENYSLRRRPGRAWRLPPPLRFYGFPDEATAYFQNTAFISDLVLRFEQLLQSIFYVGPLRENPRRLYPWSGEIPDHVGEKGERAVEAILAAGDRAFNFKRGEHTRPLGELVAERLRSMHLIQHFEVRPLGPNRNEYEVLVRTGAKTAQVKVTDVGFGVSQVLPVIVECFYVPQRSIVIMEQPEIHLHPRVQSELADLFIDAIHAREDGDERKCQFIIESHSEHFLRRLQRRIADEKLTKEEVALYFVRSAAEGAKIEELKLDEFGNIENWPDDFFGDEMEDLVARSEAQAARAAAKDSTH